MSLKLEQRSGITLAFSCILVFILLLRYLHSYLLPRYPSPPFKSGKGTYIRVGLISLNFPIQWSKLPFWASISSITEVRQTLTWKERKNMAVVTKRRKGPIWQRRRIFLETFCATMQPCCSSYEYERTKKHNFIKKRQRDVLSDNDNKLIL